MIASIISAIVAFAFIVYTYRVGRKRGYKDGWIDATLRADDIIKSRLHSMDAGKGGNSQDRRKRRKHVERITGDLHRPVDQ